MTLLTIPNEVASQTYTVVAPQTVFPFTFAVFAKADLHFAVGTMELAQTDFTLAGTVLDGGGYQGGTVTLNTPVSNATCTLWRETTTARASNFSPVPAVPVRDIDVQLNRLTAICQDIRRDVLNGPGIGGVSGVTTVNGRSGTVVLTFADVGCVPATGGTFTGAVLGLTAAPGDNTTKFATTAFVANAVASIGGGVTLSSTLPSNDGVAAIGVGTTAARADHVHNLPTLTALGAAPSVVTTKGDLYTFSTVAQRLAVGSSAQILVADPLQTTGLKWTNLDWSIILSKPATFPPSAHTHVYSDVTNFAAGVIASAVAGPGVTLATVGGQLQISAAGGGGGLPFGYTPSWENGVTTGNVAATNVTNLQALINTLTGAGGGTIWFNNAGAYQINSTITLKSNVSFRMVGGAYFSWVGAAGGTIFQTDNTTVMTGCHYDLFVNEGAAFTGTVLRMHSAYRNTCNVVGLGVQTAAGTFMYLSADSSGTGGFTEANLAFNKMRAIHLGTCGIFFRMDGLTSGIGGNPQVCTLNNFEDFQATNCLFRGIKIDTWSDSNIFSGQTRMNMTGSTSIGVIINEGRTNNGSVYNTLFEHLAPDTFSTGLSRYGVVLQESKGIYCNAFYQTPAAENGDLLGTNCTSYQFRHLTAGDTITYRQKGINAPTL